MHSASPEVNSIHELYCRASGMVIGLRYDRERSWATFLRDGFTESDLTAVISRLLTLIKSGERRVEALKFSNLIQSLDRFEEELAVIKAEANGLKSGEKTFSVYELQCILKLKEEEAQAIQDAHARNDTFGLIWEDAAARRKHILLQHQCKEIKKKIGNYL